MRWSTMSSSPSLRPKTWIMICSSPSRTRVQMGGSPSLNLATTSRPVMPAPYEIMAKDAVQDAIPNIVPTPMPARTPLATERSFLHSHITALTMAPTVR